MMQLQQHRAGAGSAAAALPIPSTSGRRLATQAPAPAQLHGNYEANVPTRRGLVIGRTAATEAEDLLQFPDRLKWYEAKFCADDMPDWNTATVLRSEEAGPGVRNLVIEAEISRERVPLRNAYRAPGQRARVRALGNVERTLAVASPPFSQSLNRHPLFLVRGDLFAYEIKSAREPESVKAELHLLVGEREAPELYAAEPGAPMEVGPFDGQGLPLKGSGLMAIYRFPTVLVFVSGRGIGTARALFEASHDVPGLSIPLRKEVRVYYQVPNQASAAFQDMYPAWAAAAASPGARAQGEAEELEEGSGCKLGVVLATRGWAAAFDDDDELVYDPATTAALILTGGDEEAEAEARKVLAEAEVTCIVSDSKEASPVSHLDSTPKSFRRWIQQRAN